MTIAKADRLPKNDRTLLKRLRRSDVEVTLAKAATDLSKSRWVAKSNRYASNTISRIAADKTTSTINTKHLSHYISASSVLHCADGWSYLGRAIHCLLHGDPHRVVHLAYYAELRAALSLLATEGIGIFQNVHYAIDAPQSVRKFPSGQTTHKIAWGCLDYWGTLRRSGNLFSEIITPGGIALRDWSGALGGIDRYVRPRAQSWFRQWSMDLGLFADDRNARNQSSYRPDGIPSAWYLTGSEALKLCMDIWEVCEPSQNSLFENIDRHILRMTADGAFEGTHGVKPTQDPTRFAQFVNSVVDPMAFETAIAADWKKFLLRQTKPEEPAIFAYSSLKPSDAGTGHAAVLARATLLLRLATGSTLKLIRSAGISANQLEFWWSQLGINRGVWNGPMDRNDLFDLWDDVAVLFDDIRNFQQATPAGDQTFQLIGSRLPSVIAGLGRCERVAIWSLTP